MTTHTSDQSASDQSASDQPTPDQNNNAENKPDIDPDIGGKLTLAALISFPAVLFMNPSIIPSLAAHIMPASYMEGLVWSIIALVSVPVILWSGSHLFITARRDLKQGRVNLNTLITLVISVAFAYSLGITIFPGFQDSIANARPFWDVLDVVMALLTLKKFLLDKNAQI